MRFVSFHLKIRNLLYVPNTIARVWDSYPTGPDVDTITMHKSRFVSFIMMNKSPFEKQNGLCLDRCTIMVE